MKKNKHDTMFFLMKTLSPTLSKDILIWTSYNSLHGKKPSRTTLMMLPVVNGSQTNWNNLYAVLREAEKL